MEPHVSRWIVGVDGSDGSEHAVRWSAAHAPNRASDVELVRSWHIPVTGTGELGTQMLLEAEPATAYDRLDELAAELAPSGVEVRGDVQYGGAAGVLLGASDGADLLVVGTRGRGGFRRLLLGSVSHQVATHAGVPVVVVPAAAPVDGSIDLVVVGVDGSSGSRAALAWAASFVGDEVPIRAVGVWSPSPWAAEADADVFEAQSRRDRQEFDAAIDDVESSWKRSTPIERSFHFGNPSSVLLAASQDADLLVVGERSHGPVGAALLGSVATFVLHHAACATVVVPLPGDDA